MRRRSVVLLLSLFIGIGCVLHAPFRAGTLSVIRAPFTLVSSLARILFMLPRLPALMQENAALQAELMRRSVELAQAREALRQSTAAKELLPAAESVEGLMASVIGRSPIPGQLTVLLNRGRRDHLRRDHIVMDAMGVVGRLMDVHDDSSVAMLVTDPNSRVTAIVERSRESGLLVGLGTGVCRLIYLDSEADVKEGDRVVTAGYGSVFSQKGLWLGTVVDVTRDSKAGSAVATVRPAANLGRLEEVLCLTSR